MAHVRQVKDALTGRPVLVRAEIEALQTIDGSGGALEGFGWFFDEEVIFWERTPWQFACVAQAIIPYVRSPR